VGGWMDGNQSWFKGLLSAVQKSKQFDTDVTKYCISQRPKLFQQIPLNCFLFKLLKVKHTTNCKAVVSAKCENIQFQVINYYNKTKPVFEGF
jgi:hypothetical protein